MEQSRNIQRNRFERSYLIVGILGLFLHTASIVIAIYFSSEVLNIDLGLTIDPEFQTNVEDTFKNVKDIQEDVELATQRIEEISKELKVIQAHVVIEPEIPQIDDIADELKAIRGHVRLTSQRVKNIADEFKGLRDDMKSETPDTTKADLSKDIEAIQKRIEFERQHLEIMLKNLERMDGDTQSMTEKVKQMDADVQSLSEAFSIDENSALQQTR